MNIFLVRHGQTDSNLNRVYNTLDEDINENGINQAKKLSEKIENIDYDIVFCSPLLRARHTCDIINVKEKKIIYDERLAERNAGNLMGTSLDNVDREEYWNFYSNILYGNEEKISELYSRIKRFIDELKDMNYENVLIVAHSGVSKAFYMYFEGLPEDGKLLKLGLNNGEVKRYIVDKDIK